MKEIDFNFQRLSGDEFEELCFEILVASGFKKVVWRKGPGDKGRDIQAKYEVVTSLLEPFEQTWFFECKNHNGGVGIREFAGAFQWADTEGPQHLVLIVSDHITIPARENLEKRSGNPRPYTIHIIEGKQIDRLLQHHSSIARRYFATDVQRLMREAIRNWVIHDLLPDIPEVMAICRSESLPEHSANEIAFILNSIMARAQEFDDYLREAGDIELENRFNTVVGALITCLIETPNWVSSVYANRGELDLGDYGSAGFGDVTPYGEYALLQREFKNVAMYSRLRYGGHVLEVLVDRNSDVTARIRVADVADWDAIAREPYPPKKRR